MDRIIACAWSALLKNIWPKLALFGLIQDLHFTPSIGQLGGKLRESGCLQTNILKALGVFQG